MTDQQQLPEGEDTTVESVAEAITVHAATAPEDLARRLEEANVKADQHWNQLLRARAEMDNLQKRQARELENAHRFALDTFVRELLQVWDSLELGLIAIQAPDADIAHLCEGTELTMKLFEDVMGKFGVQRLDPVGAPFDPNYHQAMSMQPSSDMEPNRVVTVMQKGCTLNGRLVRPALVIVSQYKNTDVD